MSQVRALTTIQEFREQYSLRQGQDAEACRLIYAGKELENVKFGKGECWSMDGRKNSPSLSLWPTVGICILADSISMLLAGDQP